MKQSKWTVKRGALALAWAWGLLGAATAAQAVTLALTPASVLVAEGETVALDLVIAGLAAGGPDSLGDFDVDIAFDDSALSLIGTTPGGGLGDVGTGDALDLGLGDLGGGLVNLAGLSLLETDLGTCIFCIAPYLDDLQGDSFVLASLLFQVDALGQGAQHHRVHR